MVVLAGSGHEAMKILEQDEEFDVVLSDSVMSNGSGEELYDWVLEHCPHLAEVFVFMTGAVHPSWSERCEILLEKPFTIGKLREIVKTVRLRGG